MKKILAILLMAIAVQMFAQDEQIISIISNIKITLPSSPDPNTANWGSGTSPFMIQATGKSFNGKLDGSVLESKILVTIKKSGTKVCGSYTSYTAPASKFSSITTTWSGQSAVSLLGQDCILKPGEYELCVQFFSGSNPPRELSAEKCKAFTIRGEEQITYQPPQAISPADGSVISAADAKKPVTFRWTPVVPKPRGEVVYKVRMIEIRQGQSASVAMKSAVPIFEKEVVNQNQMAGISLNQYPIVAGSKYGWYVQATNKEGRPVGGNNGYSAPFQFNTNNCNRNLWITLVSVACLTGSTGLNNYKVCVNVKYTSSSYNLTFNNAGSGFTACMENNHLIPYTITNLSPALQSQSSGSSTTLSYCFNVNGVPPSELGLDIHLLGDEIATPTEVCPIYAETGIKIPQCPQQTTCDCGRWGELHTSQTLNPNTPPFIGNFVCGSQFKAYCGIPLTFGISFSCLPLNNPNCLETLSWKIEKDNVILNSGSNAGLPNITGVFTPSENGTYTLTFTSTCNGVVCPPCVYTIIVENCCPHEDIVIYKNGNPLPDDIGCIEPGTYTFKLSPDLLPSVSGTYNLMTTSNNQLISSGTFTSTSPLSLVIPSYICNSVTGFRLTYKWNMICSSTIDRSICKPLCCDFISFRTKSWEPANSQKYPPINITASFNINSPVIITKLKVQILEASLNGAALENTNILKFISTLTAPWGGVFRTGCSGNHKFGYCNLV